MIRAPPSSVPAAPIARLPRKAFSTRPSWKLYSPSASGRLRGGGWYASARTLNFQASVFTDSAAARPSYQRPCGFWRLITTARAIAPR